MTTTEPPNLLSAIAQISNFSYEGFIEKYPFLREYLKKNKDPKGEWNVWVTAAGAGYALSTKEAYKGEHDELIKSISNIKGYSNAVENFAVFIQDIYKTMKEQYPVAIGFWIIMKIKNGKPTADELKQFPKDIGKMLDLTIRNFEAKQLVK